MFLNPSRLMKNPTLCFTLRLRRQIWLYPLLGVAGCLNQPKSVETNPAGEAYQSPTGSFKGEIKENADTLFSEGEKIFRYDTFGSEVFWGDQLRLHQAILGEKQGGVGAGLTAKQA